MGRRHRRDNELNRLPREYAAIDWQTMPNGREKYAAYLCSREWSVKETFAELLLAVRMLDAGQMYTAAKSLADSLPFLVKGHVLGRRFGFEETATTYALYEPHVPEGDDVFADHWYRSEGAS